MYKSVKIIVNGRVQGVGFRPFIFSLANKYDINGTVQNNMDGVFINAESETENIEGLINEIKNSPPRLARVDKVLVEYVDPTNFKNFKIIPSDRTGKSSLIIPVDSAVCEDCISEMKDPKNFRYLYPFINCTQCGPRYTIIEQLPYDRQFTAMSNFNMCEECLEEYQDPNNRRHHAQPIACDRCGPEVNLYKIDGTLVATKNEAIEEVKNLLEKNFIVAIKGLGGYHLACNANNELIIAELRKRKKRPNRPLAVMAASIDVVNELCEVSLEERDILSSPEAPIVVLKQKNNNLPKSIAPGMKTLGCMLPYTPIHHLLFSESSLSLLIMTSANPSGLPILFNDEQAFSYLDGISDYVLTTNRNISHPLDDSVLQLNDNSISFFRRSRGYVPDPITTKTKVHEVVALGGQQKNVFAIGRHQQIFLGPHIGDMDSEEVIDFFKSEYNHLMKWMSIQNKIIAIDKHPLYATRELAYKMEGDIIEVQHHHAHHVSCMEDNNLTDPCFGIILDGTGYGEDGNIWGFELFYADALDYKRLAHLKYTPLPGSDKAIKEPWRNAVGMLIGYYADEGKEISKKIFSEKAYEIDIIDNMIRNKINSPLAGTCGRLFDAVSSILGVCSVSTYDGEAAILLSEMIYDLEPNDIQYNYSIDSKDNQLEFNFSDTIIEIIKDFNLGKEKHKIVQAFHQTIISACTDAISLEYSKNPLLSKNVVLSGGSFYNKYLTDGIVNKLAKLGFNAYTHSRVPCGDGGIAFGQIIIASKKRNFC
ncbi:MAG: carbamoyltransferase HypF [Vulcanibacillus sp.]